MLGSLLLASIGGDFGSGFRGHYIYSIYVMEEEEEEEETVSMVFPLSNLLFAPFSLLKGLGMVDMVCGISIPSPAGVFVKPRSPPEHLFGRIFWGMKARMLIKE